MPRPTYTFDNDGHTVVEGDSAKKNHSPFGFAYKWGIITIIVIGIAIFVWTVTH